MSANELPEGWTEAKVRRVFDYYDNRTEDEEVAELEAAWAEADAAEADRYNRAMTHISRITVEPGRRAAKPTIRGMRIAVGDVLGYLAGGMTEAEIIDDFPELTHEDFLACYASAARDADET
jgi:uncharacterized protein (DUF433 family)